MKYDVPLLKENFEAWQYGPVLPSIYKFYKGNGRVPISKRVEIRDLRTGEFHLVTSMESESGDDAIFATLATYGRKSPGFLVDLTHNPNGPWKKTVDKARTGATIGLKISDSVIRSSFRSMMMTVRGPNEREAEETAIEDVPLAGYGPL